MLRTDLSKQTGLPVGVPPEGAVQGPRRREKRDHRPAVASDQLQLTPATVARRAATRYSELVTGTQPVAEKLTELRQGFHPDAQFHGPVFGNLSGRQVFGKFGIELAGGADIRYAPVGPEDVRPMSKAEIAAIDPAAAKRSEAWQAVSLSWTADYELGGNPIRNEVRTQLAIDADGKIREHRDAFDKDRWMDQAVPFVPGFIRHSEAFRRVTNFALGVVTYFKGE